ncbi:Iba57p SCDLUD_000051 [Saccharomycodes ludwigii]|uniref:Iba57p n=1 Tax=Saccharomycodes ludwigii TaxID=36035 RepID=UPI001E84F081|nr:hypothetical protein SCDLUD_000051 [Saccharomycodes ludwigii]KAH3902474.1 hypothetical protein SCDLUD_000051 [Saccharomycodes ludwigii]
MKGRIFNRFFNSSSKTLNNNHKIPKATCIYTELPKKSYISIYGPDTPKFLNGLITTKLVPKFIKKNLMTITPEDLENSDYLSDDQITNDLYDELAKSYGNKLGQYTGILNSRGRLVTDAIVYTPFHLGKKYPEYWLEIHGNSMLEKIWNSFQKHKLMSKVKIKHISQHSSSFKTWHLSIQLPPSETPDEHKLVNGWLPSVLTPLRYEINNSRDYVDFSNFVAKSFFDTSKLKAIFLDRRSFNLMGNNPHSLQDFRVITDVKVNNITDFFQPDKEQFKDLEFCLKQTTPLELRNSRYELGYLETDEDITTEALLPLELGYHYIDNTISFNKGCYVGQELTARLYSTGKVKKLATPIKIGNEEQKNVPIVVQPNGKFVNVYTQSSIVDNDFKDEENVEVYNPFTSKPSPFPGSKNILVNRPRKVRPVGKILRSNELGHGVALIDASYTEKYFFNDTFKPDLYINGENNEKIPIFLGKPFWFDDYMEEQEL